MNNERLEEFMKQGRQFRKFETVNIRAAEENPESDEMVIEGVACVFDRETVLFEFDGIEYKEKVDPNAFENAIMDDVIFNYNHGGRVYARTRNDSLQLEVKEDGLHVRIQLKEDDNGHQELYRDIKDGLIDRMSYCYTVADGGIDYDTENCLATVKQIKKLYDVSAVDIPAYDSTSISARSILDLDKSEREKLASETLKKKNEQRKRIALAIKIQSEMI